MLYDSDFNESLLGTQPNFYTPLPLPITRQNASLNLMELYNKSPVNLEVNMDAVIFKSVNLPPNLKRPQSETYSSNIDYPSLKKNKTI